MTNETVADWISAHYPTPESAKMQCDEATEKLVDEFQFLRRVRGRVLVGINFRPHWWCVDLDGKIIDPTAHQWQERPTVYDKISDDEEEPHGKCLHCGDLLYRSKGAESYYCHDCV